MSGMQWEAVGSGPGGRRDGSWVQAHQDSDTFVCGHGSGFWLVGSSKTAITARTPDVRSLSLYGPARRKGYRVERWIALCTGICRLLRGTPLTPISASLRPRRQHPGTPHPSLTPYLYACPTPTPSRSQVSEQMDSLRVLFTDPVDYLVTPRVLASMIAGPILNVLCFCMGAAGRAGWGRAGLGLARWSCAWAAARAGKSFSRHNRP